MSDNKGRTSCGARLMVWNISAAYFFFFFFFLIKVLLQSGLRFSATYSIKSKKQNDYDFHSTCRLEHWSLRS